MQIRTPAQAPDVLPTLAQLEARLPLIRRIAFEIHDRVRSMRSLRRVLSGLRAEGGPERALREAELDLGGEQTAYLSCLIELSGLGCALEQESPVMVHARVQLPGGPTTACWVIGESRIAWCHPPDASPGTARQPIGTR
mgnify:FL=1